MGFGQKDSNPDVPKRTRSILGSRCPPEPQPFAAGHHSGLIVFKLEREWPAFSVFQDTLHYIRSKYVRAYDFNTGADIGLLSVRKFGSPYVPPRTLSFSPAERAVILTINSDNGGGWSCGRF